MSTQPLVWILKLVVKANPVVGFDVNTPSAGSVLTAILIVFTRIEPLSKPSV